MINSLILTNIGLSVETCYTIGYDTGSYSDKGAPFCVQYLDSLDPIC